HLNPPPIHIAPRIGAVFPDVPQTFHLTPHVKDTPTHDGRTSSCTICPQSTPAYCYDVFEIE
ncbi:MAG: hypothetical protein P3B98_12765, partial [Gemmatimonadota bacterium]|nr:hypothetical protein [Gemmatimonadota bacterium]